MKLKIIYGNKSNMGVYFFHELMYPLYHMLIENGHECDVIDKACDVNNNIQELCIGIFNCVPLHKMPKKYILYSIEPNQNINKELQTKMARAVCVLQTYTPSYTQLYQYNINTIYFPITFHPSLTNMYQLNMNCDKNIDVLFYGSLNDRRRNIIKTIKQAGINIYCPNLISNNRTFGKDKDALIYRSKIILITNYYDTDCDHARSIYLMSNKKMIISDDYGGANELKSTYKNIFPVVPTNKLTETIEYYLRHPDKIEKIENDSYNFAVKYKHINDYAETICSLLI